MNEQVAVGELELNHEYNLMQWSVEDFENKIHVSIFNYPKKSLLLVFLFLYIFHMGKFLFLLQMILSLGLMIF